MPLRALLAMLLWGAVGLATCGCGQDAGPQAADAAPAPSLTRVTADRADLLFRYAGAEAGSFESATTLDAVPADKRASVQVVDLSLAPEARGAGRYVQVFDLRTPAPDGSYPGKLVPRGALEEALAAQTARPAQKPVIVYSAAWCGICRKAMAMLDREGIAYVDRDIEKDPGADAELKAKAAKAGVQVSGVPVFDVGGRILPGYDEGSLLRAIRGT